LPHHEHRTSHADVVIIGGGLSGLSAAVHLAQRGAHVFLLEQSQKLGGRCYSYLDETTGDIVDNGQHLLVGAYHHTLDYLTIIGTRHYLKELPNLALPFHHPEKGFATFEVLSLPQPFHLTAGILKFKILSFSERRKMLNVGVELRRKDTSLEEKLSPLTVEHWLNQVGQSEEAKRSFWYPLATAVMNEVPQRASALLFARSLKQAIFGKISDVSIFIPTVGQTQLYVDSALQYLNHHKGKIYPRSEVETLLVEKTKVVGVKVKDGNRILSDYVISAVPYFALKKFLPVNYRNEPPFDRLDEFDSSPIVSINLWFDKHVMDMEYVGLIGKQLQWVFNRRKIFDEQSKPTGYLSAVISAAYDVVDLPKEEIVKVALHDLQSVFPDVRNTQLLHAVVIKEKRASFSATPASNVVRLTTATPIENFYLAGDWTQTGLPATIEGAILSGVLAAKQIDS
jgi:squalene-associated FAD-dependent desaturase